jgi:hypothetical protein
MAVNAPFNYVATSAKTRRDCQGEGEILLAIKTLLIPKYHFDCSLLTSYFAKFQLVTMLKITV